jgi:hypothetical protein
MIAYRGYRPKLSLGVINSEAYTRRAAHAN